MSFAQALAEHKPSVVRVKMLRDYNPYWYADRQGDMEISLADVLHRRGFLEYVHTKPTTNMIAKGVEHGGCRSKTNR